MTLALADVCDLDCVVSWRPLVLDVPATERYARGGDAIVRRILYKWARLAGLLDLCGKSFAPGELVILRSRLSVLAEEEDFVQSITIDLQLDDTSTAFTMAAAEILIDGRPYALEVATGDASAAILALGSTG